MQTCVSLWQSCTGFGGSQPARPGQIDLSGFPPAVTTRVGCDENARNPFTRPRASASQTSPNGLREDINCLIRVHWEGTDPNSDARVDYQINVERFNTEVDAVSSEEKNQGVFLGCAGITLCDARATATLPLVLSDLLDNIFAAAKQPGKPSGRGTYIDLQVIDRICAGGTAIPPGRERPQADPGGLPARSSRRSMSRSRQA